MGMPYAEVIGDPIAHSKSPIIHKFWLEMLGIEGDYRATRVTAGDLPDYLAARRADPNWRGCNLTMPLKVKAVAHLDEANAVAAGLGATNCILRSRGGLYGTNFDSEAVLQSLVGLAWSGHAVLVGNGGAARAALWAIRSLGFDRITIMCRDPARGAALVGVNKSGIHILPLGGAPECELLINATPLGMTGRAALPVSLDAMAANGTVFEMVYDPLETRLVADARARGLRVFDGLDMLIEQASMSFVSFFNAGITDDQRLAARERLTR